jgi:hypothetical protein
MPGRITFADEGRALVAGDIALGAGWGGAATVAITAGSNSQRGQVAVTASATTPAQATSTITITFPKAFDNVPFPIVCAAVNTQAQTEGVIDIVATATTLAWKANVLPVSTKVYTYNYFVAP